MSRLPRCRPIKLDWYEWWLIEMYRDLPPDDQRRLVDVARTYVHPIYERISEAQRLAAYQRAVAYHQECQRLRSERRKGLIDGRAAARKHSGTGMLDTPQETQDAMLAAYAKGDEPMTDIAKRFGVIYSAAHTMAWRWNRERQGEAPSAANVIAFPQGRR